MKKLECSSKGDKRFSALYAMVSVNGVVNSIEKHYQSVKFKGEPCNPKRCKKGEHVEFIVINNKILDVKYLTAFYKLLWIKYFINNKDLFEYAKGFDEFNDMFKGKSINCQADVIKELVEKGMKAMFNDIEVQALIKILRA